MPNLMKSCQFPGCTSWSQWRVSGKNVDGADQSYIFCNYHKNAAMATPILNEQKAAFCGAIPDTVGAR